MCLQPISVKVSKTKYKNRKGLLLDKNTGEQQRHFVPCGKCIKCESKKRHDWAFRMYQENLNQVFGYFITLTYAEDQVPWLNLDTGEVFRTANIKEFKESDRITRIVQKSDVQLFIKRIRSDQKYYSEKLGFENYPIRYYAVSEYGTKYTKRPHYHIIMWGLDPSTVERLTTQKKIWQNGIATADPLDDSMKTFFYVTKYLYKQKRLNQWKVPPFTLMSTKPYIGHQFEKHGLAYMTDNNKTVVEFPKSERVIQIPRIYKDKLSHIKRTIANGKIKKKLFKLEDQRVQLANHKKRKNHHLTVLEQKVKANNQHEAEQAQFNSIMK